ncbi:MAG TPA: LptA/OstA family protein [Bacteriovoracaceae bacterium]|nr:LptA/OstA family protein [Bacteriovoracaceae bacterium]
MKIRDPKSISVIGAYIALNIVIVVLGLKEGTSSLVERRNAAPLAKEQTEVVNLDYFNIKQGKPVLSLKADEMKSLGEESAYFVGPHGIYYYQNHERTLKYRAEEAFYEKEKAFLRLLGSVELIDDQGVYQGKKLTYFFEQDMIEGVEGIHFDGVDPQTKDKFKIQSLKVNAYPQQKISQFEGDVRGKVTPQKKYQPPMDFNSSYLKLNENKSQASLWGGVRIKRGNYLITGGNAELFFQNYNKNLKYFVLNDDVKVTETLRTPEGIVQRRSFSESLEGFGSDKKMVLSGAPRVEQGKDVIKGYRITIRENAELIEVDDAMSDVQVKRKKN